MESQNLDIVASGVTKHFGNLQALRGIDLKLQKGDFLTLFGPNGAGKTTLIKLFATLSKPTSGDVKIAGFDVRKDSEKIRAIIGVISHDPYLYNNLSALENIIFFASMYGISRAKEKSIEIIEKVGLGTRINDLVRNFSQGMKQRLAVARALVHDPEILLLDEPFSGLDQHGARVFGDMLKWLKSHKKTIFMTTHNTEESLELSDRVAIINEGKVVYESDISEIEPRDFKNIYFGKVNNIR